MTGVKRYRVGFSKEGLTAFLLAMLPNILWALVPPANDVLAANAMVFPVWEAIASLSQWVMIAALVILVRADTGKGQRSKAMLCYAAACLVGYYACWILYYSGIACPWLFIGMAVLPTAYFTLAALWLKNRIALVPAILFGTIHIALACVTYL